MPDSAQALLAIQGTITALSGGFNALHFAQHLSSQPGKKLAAQVLSLVNLSFLLQGIWWMLLPAIPEERLRHGLLASGPPLLVGLVTLASSLAITALVLRQRLNGSGK